MIRTLLAVPLLAAAVAAAASDTPPAEIPFTAAAQVFADAPACRAHLRALVAEARADPADAAEGPYEIGAGDVRAHIVQPDGSGHRITEFRCLEAQLGSRSWTHSMEAEEEEFTVDSVARRADWLKDGRRQQQ